MYKVYNITKISGICSWLSLFISAFMTAWQLCNSLSFEKILWTVSFQSHNDHTLMNIKVIRSWIYQN